MSGQGESALRHRLLCAVPQLLDPNFHRSVILMLEHSDEGAMGLVLNNVTDTSIAEVAESLDLTWRGEPDAVVRSGGPVEEALGWILHDRADWDPECQILESGLLLTTSLVRVMELGNKDFGGDDERFLFMLGYAGWGPGQLESEMASGSWVDVPFAAEQEGGVCVDWLFETAPAAMWEEALRSIGIDPIRIVGLQGGGGALH